MSCLKVTTIHYFASSSHTFLPFQPLFFLTFLSTFSHSRSPLPLPLSLPLSYFNLYSTTPPTLKHRTSVLFDEKEGDHRNANHHRKQNEFNPNTSEALTANVRHIYRRTKLYLRELIGFRICFLLFCVPVQTSD